MLDQIFTASSLVSWTCSAASACEMPQASRIKLWTLVMIGGVLSAAALQPEADK